MSRLLLTKEKEQQVLGLLGILKGAKGPSKEVVEIERASANELVGLMELILEQRAVVIEDDLSPAEAGQIASVSRPTIMHLLEKGVLKGYPVKSQWRIKKDSLLKYIEERESFGKVISEMDENGFGLD